MFSIVFLLHAPCVPQFVMCSLLTICS